MTGEPGVLKNVSATKKRDELDDPTTDLAQCFLTISDSRSDLNKKLSEHLEQYGVDTEEEIRESLAKNSNKKMPNSYEIKLLLAKLDELKRAMKTLSSRMHVPGKIRDCLYEELI